MSGTRFLLASLVLATLCAMASVHRAESESRSCPAYLIIDSRGSGEDKKQISPPGAVLAQEFKSLAKPSDVQVVSNPYPAVGILPTLKQEMVALAVSPLQVVAVAAMIREGLNGVGALARIKRIGAYHQSVLDGEQSLKKMIADEVSSCGSSRIVLVGYSQGAQVAGDVYQSLSASMRSHVLGVVLFGDPRYSHSSFADMAKRDNNGILPVRGEFPADSHGKVLSYCHARDPICQGLGQFALHLAGAHTTYGNTNEPKRAAKLIFALTAKQTPAVPAPSLVAAPLISGQRSLNGVALGLVGNVVSVATGTWKGSPTSFAYQWYRCDSPPDQRQYNDCVPIAGASSSTYTLSADDLGHSIQAKVTASNSGGSAMALGYAHTSYGNWNGIIGNIGAPTPVADDFYADIDGVRCGSDCVRTNLQPGTVLVAHPGTWDAEGGPSNITFSYQWKSCKNQNNIDCTLIPGATSATYVVSGQYGGWLDVIVKGSNQYGANGIYYG